MDKDNGPLEGREDISPEEEIQILKSQLAGFEESSLVYEKSVLENTDKLYAEIARQKELEEALQSSRLQLSEAMELARIVYWEFDPTSRTLEANDAFYKFNGTTAEIEGGYHILMEEYARRFIHPDDLHIFLQHKKLMDSNPDMDIPADLEHRIVRRDGEVRYIINRTRFVRDAEGRVIRVFGANQDITERKKMEEEISRSLSLLNATLDSTADGILVVDLTGKIVNFNNRFLEMWHIPDDVIKSKNNNEVLAFVLHQLNNPDEFMAKVREMFTEPEVEKFNELHFKDGRVFERYSRPQRLGNHIVGRVSSFRDVTEQKRTEQALRNSEEKFRAMLETTSDFIWEADLNGIYTYASPRIKNILGYEPEEIVGKRVVDFKSPEDAERIAGIIMEYSKSALPILEVEATHVNKDGRPILLETNAVPIFDAKGQLSGYRGIDRDITQRKKAENALKENVHFLQTLIDAIPNPVFYKDTQGVYLGCNNAFESYIGMKKNEIVGKSAYDISPKELADRYHEMDMALFNQGGVQIYEAQVKYADGSLHNVIFNKAIYLNSAGVKSGLVGVILDITKRKQAEEALEKSYAILKSVVESPREIAIFALDRDYRYIAFNINHSQKMKELWEADISVGVSMLDYFRNPEKRQKAKNDFDRVLSGESFTSVEPYVVTALETRYFESIFNSIIDGTGDAIGITVLITDTTDRMQAEEKLRISEAYYKSLIENISDIISIIDPDGTIRYESPSVEHVMGYKPSEIIGQSVFLNIHPEDLGYMKEHFHADLTQHGAKIPDVIRRRHKDGSWRVMEVSGLNMLEDKMIKGMLIISRDITERKKTEELLRQSEERYRLITENAHDTIWTMSLSGQFTYISPAVKRLTGYTPEEAIKHSIEVMMTPASATTARNDMVEMVSQSLAGKIPEPSRLELEFIRKDGATVWAEVTANGMYDASGKLIGLQGVSRDITERKKAQEESETQMRCAALGAEIGVCLTRNDDLMTMLQRCSEAFGRYLDITFVHIWTLVKNKDILELQASTGFHPSLDGQYEHIPVGCSKIGIVAKEKKPFIINNVKDDPDLLDQEWIKIERLVSFAGYPLIVEDELVGALAMFSHKPFDEKILTTLASVAKEISIGIVRKWTENEIRELNDALERKVQERTNQLVEAQEELVRKEKLAILGQLAGIVGHEIRNPLGVINNAAYFLKTVLTDADEIVKEYLDMIKHEVANSQRIITDLLDFARTRPPHNQTVDTISLINQTMDKCFIPENIPVATDFPETLPRLWVDPAQIEQVFQNLITNAVQAMPEGGALRVSAGVGGQRAEAGDQKSEIRDQRSEAGGQRLEAGDQKSEIRDQRSEAGGQRAEGRGAPDSNFVEIVIADTGPGILPENIKRIFQPLFTTKAQGIGLGLVVCKNLVEANGGKIDVRSEPGKGATFSVSLPVEQWVDD